MNSAQPPGIVRTSGRWTRWAIRVIGVTTAYLVSQLLPALIVLVPIDAGDVFLLAVEIGRTGLLLGAAVAILLEADVWLRGRVSTKLRLLALTAAGATALFAIAPLGRADMALRLGLAVSERSLFLHGLWSNTVVGLLAMVYLSRRRETRDAEQRRRLDEAKLEQTRRQLAQTLANAAQTRLDPETLFACLHRARDLYPVDPAKGDELLDRLTRYLRLALGSDAPSTLGREAAIAAARLELERGDADPALDVCLTDELGLLPYPSGLLTQIVQAWWMAVPRGAERILRVDALALHGVLRVSVEGPCEPPPPTVVRSTDVLRQWTHRAASVTTTPGPRPRLHLESPHAI
jgi:hypothetical protein